MKGSVRLASEDQLDELRLCVIRSLDKLRGRLTADVAEGWIGNVPSIDRILEGFLPPTAETVVKTVANKRPRILIISRGFLPTPGEFMGFGWNFWLGPQDGDGLQGEPDEDVRSVALGDIDFAQAKFVHCLQDGERSITGEVKFERMKVMPNIRYDFGVGVALFQEKDQATLRWLYDTYGITWFELATVLRDPTGRRSSLSLRRVDGSGSWSWHCDWLVFDRDCFGISPVSAN